MRALLESHATRPGLADCIGMVGTSATAFLASVSVSDVCTVAVAAVTVFTMMPLGVWRWRAFWRSRKGNDRDEPPAPPCA